MRNKAATPLPQEWCHLIVIALVFCIPIMSAFSAAYLLIVRLMLIEWDVLIRRGTGMDFLLRPAASFRSSTEAATCGKSKLSLTESRLGDEDGEMARRRRRRAATSILLKYKAASPPWPWCHCRRWFTRQHGAVTEGSDWLRLLTHSFFSLSTAAV